MGNWHRHITGHRVYRQIINLIIRMEDFSGFEFPAAFRNDATVPERRQFWRCPRRRQHRFGVCISFGETYPIDVACMREATGEVATIKPFSMAGMLAPDEPLVRRGYPLLMDI